MSAARAAVRHSLFWCAMRRVIDIQTEISAHEVQIKKAIDDRDWQYAEMLAKRLDELERDLRLSEAMGRTDGQ